MLADSSPQDPFANKSEDTIAIMRDGSYADVQLNKGEFTGFTLHEPGGKLIGEYSVGKFERGDTIGYSMIENYTSKPGALDLTAWYLTKNTPKQWFEIAAVASEKIFGKYSHADYKPEHLPNGIRCPAAKAYEVSQRKLESRGWTLRAQIRDVNLSQGAGAANSAHVSGEPDPTPMNIMDPKLLAKMLDEAEFDAGFEKMRGELGLPQKRKDNDEERAAAFNQYKAGTANVEKFLKDYKQKYRSEEKVEQAATVKRQTSPKR
jgi:hypothetical protein